LAIAVIGGFIVAMPLLLVVFPTIIKLITRKFLANEIVQA
jgi:multidrug efflux pump subunit AcrB